MLDLGVAGSIAEELARATEVLRHAGMGAEDARREALRIWSALADSTVGTTWLERERPAPPARVGRFREVVGCRAGGVPFAYALGRVAFRTLELLADRRALIPRPETEGLVERVLQWATGAGASGGVAADLGTGCGCIALSLAVEGEFDRVVATDLSPAALALARQNLARVAPSVPVEFRLGDWLDPVAGERCRVVVANPPYLRDDEWAGLEPGVREFEPRLALASGWDGLAAPRTLIQRARDVLEPGGLLALEIDERRAADVVALAWHAGWRDVALHHDLFGRPRYVLAVVRGDT